MTTPTLNDERAALGDRGAVYRKRDERIKFARTRSNHANNLFCRYLNFDSIFFTRVEFIVKAERIIQRLVQFEASVRI